MAPSERLIPTISEDRSWKVQSDSEGLLFSFTNDAVFDGGVFSKATPITQERAASLRILEEQGEATRIKGGMRVLWEPACRLSPSARGLLDLPSSWPGKLVLRVRGRSSDSDFSLALDLYRPNGKHETGVTVVGGMIAMGSSLYLGSSLQYQALQALENFQRVKEDGDLDQYSALAAIQAFQECQRQGLDIDLEAYEELEIAKPDAVRVSLEELNDGSLSLTPDLCQKVSGPQGADSVVDPEEFDVRIDEYIGSRDRACVPVGKKLILLDEKAVNGVREIIRNRTISAADKENFLAQPTAWISAEYVDLDLGFSDRVRGAGQLRVAYFGETDESGIVWVDAPEEEEKPETLDDSDGSLTEGTSDDLDDFEESAEEPIVLDIELADEGDSSEASRSREAPRMGRISSRKIDLSKLKRIPFPHQEEGIRWLLELALAEDERDRWPGALLADDMGLGKTFTVLTYIREHLEIIDRGEKRNPVLIVAPVSLFSVWKAEIEASYEDSPFDEVVVLHSSEDLHRFRKDGARREILSAEPEDNAGEGVVREHLSDAIRYALRLPEDESSPHPNCIGMPGTIVITNYETVRDYQFSLARIPWSIVALDEAQAIKNPNAMATRAVKALKADFTVVMTGTPVENSLKDFWCLMDRVSPGFLNNYQPFRHEYIDPILRAKRSGDGELLVQARNTVGETLREKVGGLMLRRLKEDHLEKLPKKEVILHQCAEDTTSDYDERILCQMSGSQLQLYDEICSHDYTGRDPGEPESRQTILGAIQNLRAVSLHPDLVLKDALLTPRSAKEAEAYLKQSAKLSLVLGILDDIRGRNEKVLIFVINKRLQKFLQLALQLIYKFETPPGIVNGDTKVKSSQRTKVASRSQLIEEFSRKEGFGVLILSPLAAGVGLTITAANHVIHLERHWNPAKEAQATDRVYRIGQKKPVSVWIPILTHPSRSSFDENLNQLLSMKSGLSNAVVTPESVEPSEMVSLLGVSASSGKNYSVGFADISGIKWDLFEALIAWLVERDGAEQVILTGRQGDKGCDVVAIGWKGENWLIQVKHHRNPASRVGRKCIQEIAGSRKYMEHKLNKDFPRLAVFSSVKKFDKDAKEFANIENAKLFGLKQIRRMFPSDGIPFRTLSERDAARETV